MLGMPLMLSIKTVNATNRDLYRLVWSWIRRFVEPNLASHFERDAEWVKLYLLVLSI